MQQAAAAENRNLLQLGASLRVQNVQALAASEDLTEIPHRYVKLNAAEDYNFVRTDDEEIPVIDLGRLSDLVSFEDEAAKLRFACEQWGFFQVKILNLLYCRLSYIASSSLH